MTTKEPLLVEKASKKGLQFMQNNMKTRDTILASAKVSHDIPEVSITRKFMQERPLPYFPQRIRKAKEEEKFGKYMEILKKLGINID